MILFPEKLFGCLHAFCNDCLTNLSQKTTEKQKVLCPICHCLTPFELVVENKFIINEQPDENQDKPKDQKCEMCDENEPAVKYCNECGDWLCSR